MSTTREKLISTAHHLFYNDGFHAVGLDRILDQVGVMKTTFYNHFASKDDLVVEVLRWHDRWWQDSFRQMLRRHGGDPPRAQLMAVPDALDELFHGGGFKGCIFINVAVEFPSEHDPAHRLAAEHKAAMEDILREIAGYAGARDAAALAQDLALVLEGAYVTQQVSGREEKSIAAARRVVKLLIEHHIPLSGAG